MLTLYPNCKINIGLRVVGKRPDAYHDLETLFYPVYAWHDVLTMERAESFSFEQDGLKVDCEGSDNLVVQCYRRMRQCFPQVGAVHIRLSKHIPFGAGLGGGSSDAAHTALGLNRLFGLHLSQAQLCDLVRPLGADCPFFIYNTPCYATGIGDILTPVPFPLSGQLVLLKPAFAVSTREAYRGIALHPEVRGNLFAALQQAASMDSHPQAIPTDSHPQAIANYFRRYGAAFCNDFEQTVFPLYPVLAQMKQSLLDAGAVYAAMSGSGSTLFGIFPTLSAETPTADAPSPDTAPTPGTIHTPTATFSPTAVSTLCHRLSLAYPTATLQSFAL